MSSPSITSQVPEKDVLCNLFKEGNGNTKYREIQSYLDSPNYTKETKIEWILYHPPEDSRQRSLFEHICELSCPKYIIEKVFDILGGEYLSSPTCIDLIFEKILSQYFFYDNSAGREQKLNLIINKVMKKLKKFPEVKLELLERLTSMNSFDIADIFQFLLYVSIEMPFVKILDIILDKGGKELVLKTNEEGQSILHTFGYFGNKELVPILKRIVDIGGDDLLKIQDKKGTTTLHHLLQESRHHIVEDYWQTLKEICGLMLDKGGKELVLKTNEDGKTILHAFTYKKVFIPIVRRIVEIGGESLFKIQDEKGDTILHKLLQQSYISTDDEKKQLLELYLNTLADNKEVVIIRNNDGKTALDLALERNHQSCIDVLTELTNEESILNQDAYSETVLRKACERKMYNEIQKFLEIGGKELLMEQDVQGNSAIHLLPACCESHDEQFQCVRNMIKIGGKDLFTFKNKEGNKPSILSQIDQYTQESQQSLQIQIGQLKEQLVLEEKRGQNEIEIVKKWHEDRHEESVTVMEKKEIEIQRLKEVEKSMKKDLDKQKDMIEKLNELSNKKELTLKQEIRILQQELSKEKLMKDEFEAQSSRPTKELHDVEKRETRVEKIQRELECSVCFDPFEDPHIVPECCHRFCFKCIDTAIKKSGKECPMCRKRISSKRSLRRDELIGKISKLVYNDDEGRDKNPVQQREEGEKSMKNGIVNQKETLKQNASNISQLEKRVAEKDEVITTKEHENNALKQEINTLKLQLSSSFNKRSRNKDESNDKIDADCINLKKRSKTNDSVASRYCTNEAAADLESENEDLLQQLKKEKASHLKTIERLENARKKLKESYSHQR